MVGAVGHAGAALLVPADGEHDRVDGVVVGQRHAGRARGGEIADPLIDPAPGRRRVGRLVDRERGGGPDAVLRVRPLPVGAALELREEVSHLGVERVPGEDDGDDLRRLDDQAAVVGHGVRVTRAPVPGSLPRAALGGAALPSGRRRASPWPHAATRSSPARPRPCRRSSSRRTRPGSFSEGDVQAAAAAALSASAARRKMVLIRSPFLPVGVTVPRPGKRHAAGVETGVSRGVTRVEDAGRRGALTAAREDPHSTMVPMSSPLQTRRMLPRVVSLKTRIGRRFSRQRVTAVESITPMRSARKRS